MAIKKVIIDKANRLYQLPPEISSFLPSEPKRSLVKKREPLDLATFAWHGNEEEEASLRQSDLEPISPASLNNLKEELAGWFHSYHKVRLDPEKEIFVGGGISQLIHTIALAFVDSGDISFIPELGIPLYRRAVISCGGETVSYTISEKNNWQPDFEKVHTSLGRVASILFLNSPHNPSGAELSEKEFANLIWLASRENIMLVNDAAYASFPSRKHVSLIAVEGGKRVGVEVYSFAYHFGLPSRQFGFLVGNREIIEGVKQASRIIPGFIPEYFAKMAIPAIRRFPAKSLVRFRAQMEESRAEGFKLLNLLQLEKTGLDGVPYLWAKVEQRRQAAAVASLLYRLNRIMVLPGTAFGGNGEGYLRFSLTAAPEVYRAAVERVKRKRKPKILGEKK